MTLNELLKGTRILVRYQGEDYEIVGCESNENDILLEGISEEAEKPKKSKVKLKDLELL